MKRMPFKTVEIDNSKDIDEIYNEQTVKVNEGDVGSFERELLRKHINPRIINTENGNSLAHEIMSSSLINENKKILFLEVLKKHGGVIHNVNKMGISALHIAVMNQEEHAVEWLLKNGADPNAKDISGKTPLHYAVDGKEIPDLLNDPLFQKNQKKISGDMKEKVEILQALLIADSFFDKQYNTAMTETLVGFDKLFPTDVEKINNEYKETIETKKLKQDFILIAARVDNRLANFDSKHK